MKLGEYKEKYRTYRKGKKSLLVLEGIHAVKHAFRFGAEFEEILYVDEGEIKSFADNVLKEEDKNFILKKAKKIEKDFFNELIPYRTRSKIIALVKKPKYEINEIDNDKPIIFLEDPANPENIGMTIRVAAAFGAGAVIVSGHINSFSASVIRAGAGLIFALPVFLIDKKSDLFTLFKNREFIVSDAEGKSIKQTKINKKSVIIFGTEREGVSQFLKDKSNAIIKLDMQKNVSSLNLATSVSAVLYGANWN